MATRWCLCVIKRWKGSVRPISHCSQLKEDTVPHCFLWCLWDLQSCYTFCPIILGQMKSFILLIQSHIRACIMYRHTERLLGENPLFSLFAWKPEMFFFFFFSIWQWSRFILTLNPSQSPESTRHISKVSRICSICFWETDAVIGYLTSLIKFSDLRHKPWNILLMGKTLSVFMISGSPWDSTMGLKEDSYIRKITNAGFILFPDLFFLFSTFIQ